MRGTCGAIPLLGASKTIGYGPSIFTGDRMTDLTPYLPQLAVAWTAYFIASAAPGPAIIREK